MCIIPVTCRRRNFVAAVKFRKYHALGNDYIVIDPRGSLKSLTPKMVRMLCDRNFGIGSDGILFGPGDSANPPYALRIFNPDGSEAEKSGNGIRIFSRYLWDAGLVKSGPFRISTPGGEVTSEILDNGARVTVEMGRVSFDADAIPVAGFSGEVVNRELRAGGRSFHFCAATIGNPQCINLGEHVSPEFSKEFGPLIENLPIFPNRTNVQFLEVIDPSTIRIEIWERGAGYTLASGSSSTAAAAAAYKTGLCKNSVDVRMPGGTIHISFTDNFSATMVGPVTPVYDGELRNGFFDAE